jgi:hypothetical protein
MLPSDWDGHTGMHKHVICRHYCIGNLILTWLSVEQCSYVKIALHNTNAWEWHVELREALGDYAILS